MDRRDDVFQALNHLIARKKPSRVHVDVSNECPMADGLSKNLYERMVTATNGGVRFVSAEEIKGKKTAELGNTIADIMLKDLGGNAE